MLDVPLPLEKNSGWPELFPSAQASLAGRRAAMGFGRRVLPKRAVGFWHAMWRCQNAKTYQKYLKNMQLIQLIVMILVIFPSI
jgi:hypothetical protein